MPSKLSVGGEQQSKDSPAKIIQNPPAKTVAAALKNNRVAVDKAKQK